MVRWVSQETVGPEAMPRPGLLAERGLPPTRHDPVVTFRRSAWEALHRHAAGSAVEVGGVLVGRVFADPADGRLLVDVEAALPAAGALGTPTYFRFTPEAWDAISRAREALHPDRLTVGWYHSHPGLGVFYSGTDRAAQAAFFDRPWSVGLVVDPWQDAHALFVGPRSERLPNEALHVYDDARVETEREVAAMAELPPAAAFPVEPTTTAGPVRAPRDTLLDPSRRRQRPGWAGAAAVVAVLGVAATAWAARRRRA